MSGAKAAAVVALMLLAACGGGKPAAETPAAAAPETDPMEIVPGPELLPRLKVEEVRWAMVGSSVTVAARVAVDDTRVTRVGSPVMGRIASLTVREGDRVQRGQLLGQLSSSGLSEAQLGFLKSLTRVQVAQRAVDRAKALLQADVIGAAELQRREAELAEATAEQAAARDQLMLLGMSAESVEDLLRSRSMNSMSRVVASMDGTVMQRKVAVGQVVQPADTMYEVADLSNVWLVAEVPEHQAGHLEEGQTVEAKIEALSGRAIHGRLSFVSSIVNPETRTVLARMDLPNPRGVFKPAMLATMILKDHPERRQVAPVRAVVRDDAGECLFVERPGGRYVLRPVKLGPEVDGMRVVLEGVQAGDRIVVDGAFHLNNERRRRTVRVSDGG